jgi:hypothetical protein
LVTIVSRIEGVLDRVDMALARQAAESARLKRVEAAAASVLSDLDAMLGSVGDRDDTMALRDGSAPLQRAD